MTHTPPPPADPDEVTTDAVVTDPPTTDETSTAPDGAADTQPDVDEAVAPAPVAKR